MFWLRNKKKKIVTHSLPKACLIKICGCIQQSLMSKIWPKPSPTWIHTLGMRAVKALVILLSWALNFNMVNHQDYHYFEKGTLLCSL